jgi:CDP-glucose 4,6-dehydratase
MRILITGHTGFKGSWLSLIFSELGHEVSGFSLDPVEGSLFEQANVKNQITQDFRGDIRNAQSVEKAIIESDPEIIFHLAAQPLVRYSYANPRETYETNVMGTYNILEYSQFARNLRAMVIVTTDKVYKNTNRPEGYREDEPLGGEDPYSSSKAMADLMTQSWIRSFPSVPTSIVRGGNVIGGGDVCKDRLLVDLIRGFNSGEITEIRFPNSVRPWQHVLDCLNGYVHVAKSLLNGDTETAWNIGPDERSFVNVRQVADDASELWGKQNRWKDISAQSQLHEAGLLSIDSTKARDKIGWKDYLPYPQSLEWTLNWAKALSVGEDALNITKNQISDYFLISDLKSVL